MRREPETNKKQRKISTMKPTNNKQKKKTDTRYWTETWKLQEKNLSITLLGQWDRASLKWEQDVGEKEYPDNKNEFWEIKNIIAEMKDSVERMENKIDEFIR